MLRLDRPPNSSAVHLRWSSGEPLFTRSFVVALLGATLFHVLGFFLFRITLFHEETPSPRPAVTFAQASYSAPPSEAIAKECPLTALPPPPLRYVQCDQAANV